MEQKFPKITMLLAALTLAGGIMGGLWLHAWQNGKSRADNTITVTGSAKIKVTSNLAKWAAGFTRQASIEDIKIKLELANSDTAQIREFIKTYGIDDANITFLPIQTEAMYDYNPGGGKFSQTLTGYNIRQEVRVENEDIGKIELLAQEAKKLMDKGIVPEYQRTEYFYTKLAELRPTLYAEATKDAQEKATAIGRVTGSAIGKVTTARTGLVQIMQPNSVDINEYGQYDLSTKEKEISATISASFELLP